ncbi:MAG: GNAT family N-acetyltransferase [Acidobacteria bacterium]|nr:GNAT family N-acetyltransferase [Acidobacteriota bacterium]
MKDYEISFEDSRLDIEAIHAALRRMYWCEDIPRDTLAKAIANSLNFAAYTQGGALVAFARVVTDKSTFAYLCDVYVLEEHRGRGLSKRLMESVMTHPDLQGLRRFFLVTRDAHGLYEQFGFARATHPDRAMEIVRPGLYKRPV